MGDPSARIRAAVDRMIGNIERTQIRQLQRTAFLGQAKCCENTGATQQQLQQCLQKCGAGPAAAQRLLQQEMKQFQTRLQRCAADCQDSVRDSVPLAATITAAQQEQLQAKGQACLSKCADISLAQLPKVDQRIREGLAIITERSTS